jgi:hypothetical protein
MSLASPCECGGHSVTLGFTARLGTDNARYAYRDKRCHWRDFEDTDDPDACVVDEDVNGPARFEGGSDTLRPGHVERQR